MRLLERFELALQSQLGIVFVSLILVLLLLGAVYWWMVVRLKRRDLLAYMHRSHYETAEALAKDLAFVGAHKAEFFGRQTVVTLPSKSFGLALVPPPELADQDCRDRYRCFWRALEHHRLPLLARPVWKEDQEGLVAVQDGLLRPDGRLLLSLKHYLFDKRLLNADREELLMRIAKALGLLHDRSAEVGGVLYHGFLLPRSLFLDFDATFKVTRFVIADSGLAFAVGPEKMHQRLTLLKQGQLPIERFCAAEITEMLPMLAPEQKDPNRLTEVGVASDLYAFGALAVTLFSQKRFTSSADVNWTAVPSKWQPFVKACLEDAVSDRPADFFELEDWLSDPEMALTHHDTKQEVKVRAKSPTRPLQETSNLTELASLLRQNQRGISKDQAPKLSAYLDAGAKSLKSGKWDAAKKQFKDALKLEPQNAEVNVNLAIALYELGDVKAAQRHFDAAEKVNPQLARKFRQHIAFRL